MLGKLSETISRKFTEILSVKNWEVQSDEGWTPIESVNKTIPYRVYEIRFGSGRKIRCADDHIFITLSGEEVFAKDSLRRYLQTDDGADYVTEVVDLGYEKEMYDLSLPEGSNHLYYANGILSHNSTCYCMYLLWLTCFFPDKSAMILAQKEATALELLKKIRDGYLYLPRWLKPACTEFNKKSIGFSNRSKIHGFSSSSDGARGMSASILVLDEFAFVPKNVADKLFTSVYPVVSSAKNGKVIIVSTPNGTDNLYYDIWSKANSKDKNKNVDGWKPFSMWWWQVPGHDEKWKQAQIEAIGKTRFAQEFNNEFISSDKFPKLIPDDILEKHRMRLSEWKSMGINQGKDLLVTNEESGKSYTVRMFSEFDPKRTYLASSDIAEGVGGDSSVLYVWDVTDLSNISIALRFSDDRISIMEFAWLTKRVMGMYCDPFLSCEANGISLGYVDQLRVTYGYENIVKLNKDNGFGIASNVHLKSRACLWMRDMMTTQGFGFSLTDPNLLDEMGTFVKKDSVKHIVYAALGDNHDDHLMAFVWACHILSPDIVDKYFIVSDTFTSSLGNIYPKTLSPLYEYGEEEIRDVVKDPVYRDFLAFKATMASRYKELDRAVREDEESDPIFMGRDRYGNPVGIDLTDPKNFRKRESLEMTGLGTDSNPFVCDFGGDMSYSWGDDFSGSVW